ncbi:hypothetical protein FN846DRAFT_946250 [Sphaerosporella brunnea]|uniref:Mid2 domain-containing protein n=1 Tax=Sphaerosporella brunnea TaxID=1250544 RepID=A0A5J5EYW2_9PEZI|nr:hypothetical protein FN846DRAFT_946250 [Sphaerosporella brunnea]
MVRTWPPGADNKTNSLSFTLFLNSQKSPEQDHDSMRIPTAAIVLLNLFGSAVGQLGDDLVFWWDPSNRVAHCREGGERYCHDLCFSNELGEVLEQSRCVSSVVHGASTTRTFPGGATGTGGAVTATTTIEATASISTVVVTLAPTASTSRRATVIDATSTTLVSVVVVTPVETDSRATKTSSVSVQVTVISTVDASGSRYLTTITMSGTAEQDTGPSPTLAPTPPSTNSTSNSSKIIGPVVAVVVVVILIFAIGGCVFWRRSRQRVHPASDPNAAELDGNPRSELHGYALQDIVKKPPSIVELDASGPGVRTPEVDGASLGSVADVGGDRESCITSGASVRGDRR